MATSPEDRYVNLTTKTLANGKVVYKSTRPIPSQNVDISSAITITTGDTDRLDIIANNAYGSSLDWWRIASINRIVNGSLFVVPGTNIIIPSK